MSMVRARRVAPGRGFRPRIRTRSGRVLAALTGLVAMLLGTAGCGGALTASHRVQITAPAQLTTVNVPFTATWSSTVRPPTRYAVFVDILPVPPGHTMRDLALPGCKRVPTCYPNAAYLAGVGVYLTSQNHLTVQNLPVMVGMEGRENPPVHTLTIVLFSGQGTRGHRVGDVSWRVEFRGQMPT